MKCLLIMSIIILVPTLYCRAESVEEAIEPIPTLEGKKETNDRKLLKQSENLLVMFAENLLRSKGGEA